MLTDLIEAYNEAIYDTDRERALVVVADALQAGATPEGVIFDLVVPAMDRMIKAISEDFDANLAQHFMTAQIAGEVTDAMLAKIESPPVPIGRIVIGTAEGDIHSLGKRIVIGCLKALLIEAVDLGVNVSPATFVEEAVACGASVIGMSAMMVHTATGAQGPLAVRAILEERGLAEKIKLIVGGAPFRFDPDLYRTVGADAVADDGIAAGRIIEEMIREVPA